MAEYRNPQQEPGNERRMLLVFAVTFALIILGQFFLFKNKPASPKTNPAETSQSAPATADATTAQAQAPASVSSAPAVAPPAGTKVASNEVETTVENDLYKIVFTNRGAQVKSWVLKKYNNDQGPGHPLDLVNHASEQFGLPLSLYTYDQNLRKQLNSALYASDATGSITAPGQLTYEYSEGGLTVRKDLHLRRQLPHRRRDLGYAEWPAG